MMDAGSRTPEEYIRSAGGRRWGRSRILLVGVIGALVLLAVGVIFSAYAAGQGADPVEGENFTHRSGTEVVTGNQYSGGKALKIISGQALPIKKEVTITETSNVLVRARAGQTGGSPTLTIRVNGTNAGTRRITSSTLSNYLYSGIVLRPGTYTIGLKGGDLAQGRYVFVDVVRFPAVNDSPVGVDDSRTVGEDSGATTIDVLANDTDVNGDPLTIASVSNPAHGTAVVESGKVKYTPAANYNGPDEFTYQVSDGNGGTDTATVSITVNSANDTPVAVNDPYSVDEDGTFTKDAAAGVLANDTDVDGDTLTAAKVEGSGPAHGTLSFSSNGSFIYTPETNYHGPDSFDYTVSDGNGGTGTATVSITVNSVNDAPAAAEDSATTNEDNAVTIDVQANDTDDDGDTLTAERVSGPSHGTLTLNANGSFSYTPAANYNGPDSFDYKAKDGKGGEDTATVSITVTPVNDRPEAIDDGSATNPAATTDEDVATGPIDVLANDSGLGDTPITVSIDDSQQGAKGEATVNSDNTITYTPNADANGSDSFVYKVCDADSTPECDTATVHVQISPVNDTPSAVDDGSAENPASTVSEDSTTGATINVLANDSGLGDTPITVSIDDSQQGAKGEATANSDNTVTYVPSADENGPDSFVYEVCDADGDCDTATVAVTISPTNDAPTLDLDNTSDGSGSTTEFLEAGGPVALAPNAAVADIDDTNIESATVTLTNRPDGDANESLDADVGTTGITKNYDSTTGVLTLTGPATKAQFEQVLRTVTYDNTATPPDQTDRTVEFKINDGDADSALATTTITVTRLNEAPVVDLNGAGDGIDSTASFTEDGGPVALAPDAEVSDADGTELESAEITLTNRPDGDAESLSVDTSGTSITAESYDSSTGILALSGTASLADYQKVLRTAKYDNSSNTPNTTERSVEFTVNDGEDESGVARSTVSVAVADDPPVAVNDSATKAEDSGATAIDVLSNDTDVDDGPETIGSVTQPTNGTVVITNSGADLTYDPKANYCNDQGTDPDDTFTYTLNGGSTATVAVTVTCVDDNPLAVNDSATKAEDSGATAIDVLSNDTDVAGGAKSITSVTQPTNGTVVITGGGSGLTYQPNDNYCNDPPGTSPDTFTYTLSPGGSSATVSVKVTCVDDPPVAVNDSATVLEDAAATNVPVLTNDTDIDGGPKTISSASDPANGTVVVTGGGTGLTYQPDPNYCNDPPATNLDTFTYTLNGGSEGTVSMKVTCVNDNPVADDETFNGANGAVGNTALVVNDPSDGPPSATGPKKSITGDILDGDNDVDGPGPLTVQAGTFASNDGGSVTIEADGDFTYVNDPADACADTSDFFDYTLTDGNSPTAGTDTGRVTISITGCVWYVSNNATGNSGTSTAPFDTLAQAQSASATGHTIFVFDGDNTTIGYAAGIDLKANQKLIGEAANLAVGSDTLHTGDPTKRPTITDSNADVVALDDANEVRAVEVDPSGTGGGIAGATGDTGGGTIDDVRIIDNGTAGNQPGLELDSTTGTFNISNLTVSTNGAAGVRLHNTATPANVVNAVFAPAGQISIQSNAGPGLSVNGTSTVPVNLGTSTFDEITVANSNGGGVSLSNATGTTTFGDGTGTDLSLTTTSGSAPAFNLASAGTVSVPSGGTANVSATGGPAVDVTGTSGANLNFDDVDSTGSAGDGVNLAGLGAGTFTANNSSSITNATGIDFDLDGGSGAITYDGSISDDVGQLVRVANTSGGTKDFNGAITDGGDGDGSGVALTTNTNATIRFDGGLTLATGANAAFAATGGGTVAVTDANAVGTAPDNTIATTTGTALNVANTTIGASGLTFRSISANGASSGIVLNNTGSNGGLIVTGTGTASSGGTIQNTTGAGVSLNSTRDVSFDRMNIQGADASGIDGQAVTNFSFTNGTINNSGDANRESAIAFDGGGDGFGKSLDGNLTVTGSTLTNSFYGGVHVESSDGTIANATVSNNTITTTNNGSGVSLVGTGTATTVYKLTKATIANNNISNVRGAGVQVIFSNSDTSAGAPASSAGIIGSATNIVSISGNSISPMDAGTHAISISTGDGSNGNGTSANRTQANFAIVNNPSLLGSDIGTVVLVGNNGFSDMVGTVSGNTIDANHTPNGGGGNGIAGGNGVSGAGNAWTPNLTLTVTNNSITDTDGNGILLVGRSTSGQANLGIRNNTVAAPLGGLRPGIRVDAGNAASADDAVCLDISANTSAGSGGSPGIGIRKQGTVATTNDFGIEGLAPSPATYNQAEDYVASLNPGSALGTAADGGQKRVIAINGDNFVQCSSAP